jgi:squid-like protein
LISKKMATNEKMDTSMAGDEDDRKLFAGGLPQDAKEADIRGHFGQYGEIESITLKTDMATGRSRGFCFIVYKTTDGLEKAVAQAEHNIQNKKVAVKKAQAKQGKVYIGKLPADLSDDDIKNHMATFGTIANIEQPFDKMKSERKNFCFITYEREDVAKKLLKEGTVYINGHEMEVKKVTPKPQFPGGMDPSQMYMMGRGGYHGGPGGHGQWGGPGGQWGGGYGGYDGGYGGGDGGYGAWGGYGGGYGGYGGGYPGGPGGKTPRGMPGGMRGGMMRGGRGGPRGGQRNKPY